MSLDPETVFLCVPLRCKLKRSACAHRYVRAAALQYDAKGEGWVPDHWAGYAVCRGCKIGDAHADICNMPRPNIPPLAELRKSKFRECEKCQSKFLPTCNRQRSCAVCSQSKRFKKLRKQGRKVCPVCSQVSSTVPCDKCRTAAARQESQESQTLL